jgi:hypothetical protein
MTSFFPAIYCPENILRKNKLLIDSVLQFQGQFPSISDNNMDRMNTDFPECRSFFQTLTI